ncbi:hypothetical protein [Fusobacterium varium]
MSENFFNFLHLYMLPFGIFMLFISLRKRSLKGILFFIPIVISGFLLLGTLEIKNEIKEEKKEFDDKLNFIKQEMTDEERKELEDIIKVLPENSKKEFMNKIYDKKYKDKIKQYEDRELHIKEN